MSFADAQSVADSYAKRDPYADCDYLSYTNSDADRLPPLWVRNTLTKPARHGYTNAKSNGYAFAHRSSGVEYLDPAAG